jgi:hypothetical protein
MKKFLGTALLAGLVVAALVVGSGVSTAQQDQPGQAGQAGQGRGRRGGGGPGGDQGGQRPQFDPAQMRARMLEGFKETLGCTDDEWKAIEPLVGNVMEKQQAARSGGFRGGFRGFANRRGPGGDQAGPGGPPGGDRGGPPGGRFGGTPDLEAEALSKALEAKDTPAKDIEARLKALRDARVKREAELKKAREELRAVLTVRQEALLVLMGMLD